MTKVTVEDIGQFLKEEASSANGKTICILGKFLATLPEDVRKSLQVAIDRTPEEYSHAALTRVFKRIGFEKANTYNVRVHRKGECCCAKETK